METYDVVVVGARVAGAATAMRLARQGRRVLLLDRDRYGTDTLSTHALMRGGVFLLSRWGTRTGGADAAEATMIRCAVGLLGLLAIGLVLGRAGRWLSQLRTRGAWWQVGRASFSGLFGPVPGRSRMRSGLTAVAPASPAAAKWQRKNVAVWFRLPGSPGPMDARPDWAWSRRSRC